MPSWKGKTRGGILGYRLFVAVLKYTGISGAYFVLHFVAVYFFLFSGSSFRAIRAFYRHRMGYGLFRSLLAVYKNYYGFGQVLLDRTAFLSGIETNFRFAFDGEHYLKEMAEQKTGGLLISAHIGNFEMAGQMLERLNTRINIIMFDAEHEKIKEYLAQISKRTFHVILMKEDTSHIYEIKQALENREITCIHGDRYLQGSKRISLPFLGRHADFPAGPFYLALKYHVPVSFVFAMKESKDQYHFYASKPRLYPQHADRRKRDEDITEMIRDYTREMENILEKYPLQWFNYYDFWKNIDG